MYGLIELFYKFDKYKKNTRAELFNHLIPALNSGQYKILYKDGQIVSYVSWAFFDELAENHFKQTGHVLNYNCGDRVWLVDLVSLGDSRRLVKWTNKHFRQSLGSKKRVNYLRMDNNSNIYRISSSLTKECYN